MESKTTALGVLVNNEETINKFNEIPLKTLSGKKAISIRKTVKKMQEEIENFNESRNQYIQENGSEGEDGNVSIPQGEAMDEAIRFLNDLAQTEVEISWEPLFDEETLDLVSDHLEFTIRDLDFLEAAGLLKIDTESSDEVREPEVEEAV